jgi:hypothetical protein
VIIYSHRIEPELPPVRDLQSAQDPRAIALAIGNRQTDRWKAGRPGERKITNPVPRALRAKGYEPVAALIGAWVGEHINVGTVRSWWRFDLAREESSYLPPPDAIIKRKGGLLLPGWADETIREWLSHDHPAFKKDMINLDTYLAWDAANDEIDPRITALLAGNQGRGIHAQPQPPRGDGVPSAYLALGYDFAAAAITEAQAKTIGGMAVCKYWRDDLMRVREYDGAPDPFSLRMPLPDAIISRGPRGDLLPGWTEGTISAWVPNRPGPGNRTSGDLRRGSGLLGMRKIGVDDNGRDIFAPATDLVESASA